MPRGKATTARHSSGRQNTLSFSTNKVTKPTNASTPLSKSAEAKAQKLLSDTHVEIATPTPEPEAAELVVEEEPGTTELSIRAQPKLSKVEDEALKISDAQVKRYWKAKEDSRISPRVHQEELTLHDKILREFDLSSHFGPCIGIAREKRWNRARNLGLQPPIEVMAVLMKENCKTNHKVQRAYVDELMTTNFSVE